jgi:hypothetical protein
MKKYILFSLLLSLACLVWQCGENPTDEPTPTRPNCKMISVAGGDSIVYDAQGRILSVHRYYNNGNVLNYNGNISKAVERNANGLITKIEQYTVSNGNPATATLSGYNAFEYDSQNRITKAQEYAKQGAQYTLWRTLTFAYSAGKVTVTEGNSIAEFFIDNNGNVSQVLYPNTPSINTTFEYGDAPNDIPKEFAYFNRVHSYLTSWGSVMLSAKAYTKYTKGTERVERVHTLNDKGYIVSTINKTFLNNILDFQSTSTYTYKCD